MLAEIGGRWRVLPAGAAGRIRAQRRKRSKRARTPSADLASAHEAAARYTENAVAQAGQA